MSAVKNILNGNILYQPRSTDPWLENFWGRGARSILYPECPPLQWQQQQSASYMAAQQAYMQATQQQMLREQAVRNAEMAYAQEMERLKQDERRDLFGEELFALMNETDRLAKLL